MQKIAIYMVNGQKFKIRVDYEVAQRGEILLDKLQGDGHACGSLSSRPQQKLGAFAVTKQATLLYTDKSQIFCTDRFRRDGKMFYEPRVPSEALPRRNEKRVEQPISGVRKRMSFIEPLYSFCKAGKLHTELTQEQCKRSIGAST